MNKLRFVFLFLILVCNPTFAVANEYEVVPYTGPERGMYEGGGADTTLSFYELPLSLQIVYISGLLGVSIVFYKFLPLFLGRIKRKCTNPNRDKILSYIVVNPGNTIADIEKDLGLNRSSIRHHVRMLHLYDKISIVKKCKFTLLFENSDNYTGIEQKIAFAMRNSTRKSILTSIVQNPGITNQEITETFDIDKSTVHWHISDMYNEGLIDFDNDGKFKRYFLKPSIEKNVEKVLIMSETEI
jgi:predicted transcriptional regulator